MSEHNRDVTLGFEGYPWHTHGDLLMGIYGKTELEAVQRFINGILNNQLLIAISRRGETITDVWIADDEASDIEGQANDERVEYRRWREL